MKFSKLDDTERLKNDIKHDVRVGGKAKVSLGGMREAAVTVAAIGKTGITATDSQGRAYHFAWEHVIGPTGEQPDDLHEAAQGAPMHKADKLSMLKSHIAAFRRG